MDKETRAFIAEAKKLYEEMDKTHNGRSRHPIVRGAVSSAMWWIVPFVVLWGLGVSPEWAARLATGAGALAFFSVAALLAAAGMVFRAQADKLRASVELLEAGLDR